tara:strand:+ start:4867 stop:5715 length:849 start_codon:yes stop_codon:yes gene_type:complete
MIRLDGTNISKTFENPFKDRITKLKNNGIIPGLGVILVGNNQESQKYIEAKRRRFLELDMKFQLIHLNDDVSDEDVIQKIDQLNNDKLIHGILVQLPLPQGLNVNHILDKITPVKDVDGFHTINAGNLFLNRKKGFVPCTPLGCIELLDQYNINVSGLNVVIIGSSNIVGLPLSIMLLQREATVTICHINTKNIREHTIRADILISCCGVPHMITENWVKDGVIVLDIGINHLDGKLVGDVDYDKIKNKCSYITPVPGGIGPMTITMLIKQTIDSAENYNRL